MAERRRSRRQRRVGDDLRAFVQLEGRVDRQQADELLAALALQVGNVSERLPMKSGLAKATILPMPTSSGVTVP